MAKYSTGGGAARDEGGSCELCGTDSDDLRKATVAGAELVVCPSCAPHGEGADDGGDEAARRRRAAQNAARQTGDPTGDSTHWEEHGTDYESDRLSYLVRDYGTRVRQARQDAGLQRGELAAELDVDENVLLAVEQGRATQADVGGSVIAALEARLDLTLAEE
ncbi:MAG: multiprotein-bridging factor 1 family protein [Halobacteriaceae archaeon]